MESSLEQLKACQQCGGQKRVQARFCPHCGFQEIGWTYLPPPVLPPIVDENTPVHSNLNAPLNSSPGSVLKAAYSIFKRHSLTLILFSWTIFIFEYFLGYGVQILLSTFQTPSVFRYLYYWFIHTLILAPVSLGAIALVLGLYDEGKWKFSNGLINQEQFFGMCVLISIQKVLSEGLNRVETAAFGVNFWDLFFSRVLKIKSAPPPGNSGQWLLLFFGLWIGTFFFNATIRTFTFLYEGYLVDEREGGMGTASAKAWHIIRSNPLRILQFCIVFHALYWSGIWIPLFGQILIFPLATLFWVLSYRALKAETFASAEAP